MTFLPIVARELRVASRRRHTYWLRTAAAFSVLVLGTWMFLMMHNEPQQAIAIVLFGIITGASVLYCLLSGVRATSDCLSEEKREGTLGLLFLTDLRGYDVVLGKLVATSINAFYSVLAVLPMMAVPLLLGGVTLGEFGRAALVAINTLFFSLSIGMCVSALCRSARTAVGSTFLIVLLFAALLPLCGALIGSFGPNKPFQPLFLIPSAGFSFYMTFHAPFIAAPQFFWWSVAFINVVGWLFLCSSVIIVPRSWQERPAGIKKLKWRERWKLWSYGAPLERNAFRRRLLNRNAFFWLAARARLKPAWVWTVLGLLACAWTWGLVKFGREWLNTGLYVATGQVLNLLLKIWVATEAGRQLAEDRQRGALELLLSTPLSVRDILRGQRLALQRQFLGPLLAVLLAQTVMMLATGRDLAGEQEQTFTILLWLAGMSMLLADLVGLYWVGMWQALVARNPKRASSGALVRIMVLPWMAMALVALFFSLRSIRSGNEPSEKFFLALWWGLGIAADFGFGAWARHKLLSEFRTAATRRYALHRGFWKRFFPPNQGAAAVQLRTESEG